eukprot:SAG11_NODE_505_length_8888_cov_12.479235_10_plen_113_part_00
MGVMAAEVEEPRLGCGVDPADEAGGSGIVLLVYVEHIHAARVVGSGAVRQAELPLHLPVRAVHYRARAECRVARRRRRRTGASDVADALVLRHVSAEVIIEAMVRGQELLRA